MQSGIVLILLLGILLCWGCDKDKTSQPAQSAAADQAASKSAASATRPAAHPGLLGPGDLLMLSISDLTGPGVAADKPVHISADGTVRLLLIDTPIKLAGLTTIKAASAVQTAYDKSNLVKHALVYVRRLEVGSQGRAGEGPIRPYDLVRLSAWDIEGPGVQTVWISRVGRDGAIDVPYLGKQKIGGLSEPDAERTIIKAYHASNIVENAMLSVFRLEPAPADAGSRDLPDAAILPVPSALAKLFEPGTSASSAVRQEKSLRETNPPSQSNNAH